MATSKAPAGRRLVIVESPKKARTIAGYLGPGFEVEASVGHIRDLPQPSELPAEMKKGPFGKFAVDVDNGFAAYYVVDADKKKKVSELKRALKGAHELFLATDEDREGEAIAWHLLEVLRPKVPVRRMVFHEITRAAIQRALSHTRDLDERLVDAQETRRILDRLYGYEVSPVLWRKVRAGLSAGRVQSVATRLVVERERDRMAFRSAFYWDVVGIFAVQRSGQSRLTDRERLRQPDADAGSQAFGARLVSVDGTRVATGRDFDDTGRLSAPAVAAGVLQLDEISSNALVAALEGAPVAVRSVEEKPYTRRPAAPFTTSTLQQEAGRKLRFSSRHAMRVAQSLYEEGYITYMRTDSTALSTEAIQAAREQAGQLYGSEYLPSSPRVYPNRSKNAQEAHEAIRPAGDSFRTPAQVSGRLSGDEFRLYELIWKRTVASQMADARGSTVSVRLVASAAGGQRAEFAASGTVITFRGFLAAYEEGRDEERNGDERRDERLPELVAGDPLDAREYRASGHQTSPPPRYTEASLVKALEERGIGRPSTYAATISVIQDRGYVTAKGSALVPTWLAFSVTRLLEEHFTRLVDYDFTAAMEEDLDRIAAGQEERVAWLSRFYFGADTASGSAVAGGMNGVGAGTGTGTGTGVGVGTGTGAGAPVPRLGLKPLVDDLGEIDARDINSVLIGDGIVLRVGRYGPYLEAPGSDGEESRRASVPDEVAPDELTVGKARELLASNAEGDRVLGSDPGTGHVVVARRGRFGPYVTEVFPEGGSKSVKPRTASLLKSMQLETVSLDDALRLLSLPRLVGVDPQSGEEITAQNGRYGPYLRRGTDSRSLATEDQVFEITLDEALVLYAQPKTRGRASAAPLRELGPDPESGAPILVKEGRFGSYVTDGTTNATLRKGDGVESITLERAAELLAEKRAQGPSGTRRRIRKSAGAKKASAAKVVTAAPASGGATSASVKASVPADSGGSKPAKKATAKKAATKKAATKKAAAKETATKKAAAKETATKETAAKQPAAKQATTKQAAAKETAAKQAATKQSAAKQAATKRSATKKAAAGTMPFT